MLCYIGTALFGFGIGIIISNMIWKEDSEK